MVGADDASGRAGRVGGRGGREEREKCCSMINCCGTISVWLKDGGRGRLVSGLAGISPSGVSVRPRRRPSSAEVRTITTSDVRSCRACQTCTATPEP